MRNALTKTGLVAHSKALEAAGIAITLVLRVPNPKIHNQHPANSHLRFLCAPSRWMRLALFAIQPRDGCNVLAPLRFNPAIHQRPRVRVSLPLRRAPSAHAGRYVRMDPRTLWRRPESRFLIMFLSILGISFLVIALRSVNDAFVVPYTTLIARVSGFVLHLMGEDITINGCVLRSPRFAVTIYNGCNGLITSLIFVSGVLAFPSRWSAKLIGVVGGLLAIQVINLVRILSLFYIGIYLP